MPNQLPEFETADIYLAAYLKIAGCELQRRRRQGHRVYFVFTNAGGSMNDMREAFFSGRGKVSAHQYSREVMAFKEMCFDVE